MKYPAYTKNPTTAIIATVSPAPMDMSILMVTFYIGGLRCSLYPRSSVSNEATMSAISRTRLPTHYPIAGLLYFYFRFLALAPSLLALRASKKE